MVDHKSDDYFILADNMIHIVKDGIRLCINESDSNMKCDPDVNLFVIYCHRCQSKKLL